MTMTEYMLSGLAGSDTLQKDTLQFKDRVLKDK